MTNHQFQFVPDGDDITEVEPRLTLVPITDTENAGSNTSGTELPYMDIPSGAEEGIPANPFGQPLCWLLDELSDFFCKYATFSTSAQPTALALWVIHTHLFEAAVFTPYMYVRAPEKGSGKSRVLEIAKMVTRNPFKMDSPSAAAIYAAANGGYTLHIDEVDTIFGGKKNEVARAALNAGFQCGGKITRFSQKKGEVLNEYKVFCPKLLAGINGIPDTIADRSIEILMERRATGTRLPRFREEDVKAEVAVLNTVLGKLHKTPEIIKILKNAKPSVPVELSDRQMDISEPLLAIADLAGSRCGTIAREALVKLFTADKLADESLGVTLLTDIQTVFEDNNRLTSAELLKGLVKLETGSPWAEKWESKMRANQVSTCANQLARYLKRYRIAPKQIRFSSTENVKGYERAAFTEAWASYCSGAGQSVEDNGATGNQPEQGAPEPTKAKPAKPDRRRAAHRKQRNTGSIPNVFRRFAGNGRPSSTSD